MSKPTETTSNYGWALWHLHKAWGTPNISFEAMRLHIDTAQVRATLALGAERLGHTPAPTVWDDIESEEA